MITKAKLADAKDIQRIINTYAKRDLMLPKSIVEVYEKIMDFYVYRSKGKVVGVAALSIPWGDLAELRSLAVEKRYAKKGIGRELVEACLSEARELGVLKVFTLTYIPAFFKKFGFKVVKRETLPHKVWTECVNCPKFPDCGEVPLIKSIQY
ncbi:MAG: N-acetyltransferase [Candidatus Firestonebacteria bacterium]